MIEAFKYAKKIWDMGGGDLLALITSALKKGRTPEELSTVLRQYQEDPATRADFDARRREWLESRDGSR